MLEVTQLISIAISGVLIPVAFSFSKSITENSEKIAKLETESTEKIAKLENHIARSYVQKDDLKQMRIEIREMISDLKDRLNRIEENTKHK